MDLGDRTLVINGVSKTRDDGWRIGYAVGPRALVQLIGAIERRPIHVAPTVYHRGVPNWNTTCSVSAATVVYDQTRFPKTGVNVRAFVVAENSSTVTELELPTPQPTGSEVLLRVTQCGVCHTDTHLRDGGYDLGSRGKMRLADRGVTYPLVMGHEVVGVVEEVGPDAVGVNVGDVRLIYPWVGCGQCHQCEAGRDNYCAAGKNLGVARHGGYADRILVPDAKYLVDITGLDPVLGGHDGMFRADRLQRRQQGASAAHR